MLRRPGLSPLPLLLFATLVILPLALPAYLLTFLTRVVILALAALSLDLLIGVAGLVSFGHAAFLGIGLYAVAILSGAGIDDIFAQSAVAVAACAAFALATGAVALRTRGVYFIMITLAFGQMMFFGATSLSAYGGDDGVTLGGRSLVLGRPLLAGDRALYFAALGVLAAAYMLGRRLIASRFGRVLAGARENQTRMEAIGFAPFRFRLIATVIAGCTAGLAGVLLANQTGFVSPAAMTWQRSGDLIFMVVLGGMGSLHGAILGAVVFLGVEEVLAGFSEHWRIVFGPLLVLAVLFARGGLEGLLREGPSRKPT